MLRGRHQIAHDRRVVVAVFDHAKQRLLLSSCVHGDDPEGVEAAHTRALSRIAALRQAIAGAASPL